MSSSTSSQMHRSISMPVQPQPLPLKTMKRSQEKETLIEEDYYPESPSCQRRKKSDNREHLGSFSQSANNFHTTEWSGSTIELNTDLRRNEIDAFYYSHKPYRVIEKSGRENVTFKKIPEKSWRFIRDFVTTLVRFILPKRYLTHAQSSPVNNAQESLKTNKENIEITNETKLIEDTVTTPTTTRDESLISDAMKISDDKLDSSNETKRVKFSLYD